MSKCFIVTHVGDRWKPARSLEGNILRRIYENDPGEVYHLKKREEDDLHNYRITEDAEILISEKGHIPKEKLDEITSYENITIAGNYHDNCVMHTVKSMRSNLGEDGTNYLSLPLDCVSTLPALGLNEEGMPFLLSERLKSGKVDLDDIAREYERHLRDGRRRFKRKFDGDTITWKVKGPGLIQKLAQIL